MTTYRNGQTLCPYTLKPLAEIEKVNKEHILPVSLGAPNSFFVYADANENTRMNDLIDEPAGNAPLLRFLAMTQGVVSRSGPVTLTLPSKVAETGEDVQIEFSNDGATPRLRFPVNKDSKTGEIKSVRGFGDDARKLAEQIQRDFAKKGKKIEIGETENLGNPWLESGMKFDADVLRLELIKIAYLMTVRVFSDIAILSRGGTVYRTAMFSKNMGDLISSGLRGSTFQPMPAIFPQPALGKHHLTCLRMRDELLTGVSLFGVFCAFFITPIDSTNPQEGLGEMLEIDLATRKLRSYSEMEIIRQLAISPAQTSIPNLSFG